MLVRIGLAGLGAARGPGTTVRAGSTLLCFAALAGGEEEAGGGEHKSENSSHNGNGFKVGTTVRDINDGMIPLLASAIQQKRRAIAGTATAISCEVPKPCVFKGREKVLDNSPARGSVTWDEIHH